MRRNMRSVLILMVFVIIPIVAKLSEIEDIKKIEDIEEIAELGELQEIDGIIERSLALGILEILQLVVGKWLNLGDVKPTEIDVKFFAFKPGSSTYNQVYIYNSTILNYIDLNKPVGFIIHGYCDSFFGGIFRLDNRWMQNLAKGTLILTKDQNIIAIDYRRLARFDYKTVSLLNVPYVGEQIANFIKYLRKLGVSLNDIEIAGHSLGAHVAGVVGNRLNGQLSTIYGLDPAGPLFTYYNIIKMNNSLDPSDAKFVQVLHTNCFLFGSQNDNGHTDYYANNGVLQKGCTLGSITRSFFCSHLRAIDLFFASCNPQNELFGEKCIKPVKCNSKLAVKSLEDPINVDVPDPKSESECVTMLDRFGVFTRKIQGTYHLRTTATFPFY